MSIATTLRRAPARPAARRHASSLLELVPPRLQDRGADAGDALEGTLRLTGLPLGGWVGEGGVRPRPDRERRRVAATASRSRARPAFVRCSRPTRHPLPSSSTPRVARLAGGVGGTVAAQGRGRTGARSRRGNRHRFPGTTGDAVIGDIGALETAINTQVPGAGRTNEIWLDIPSGAIDAVEADLARPPFRAVEAVSRRALVEEARNDPLGHGTLLALAAAALVALLLAARRPRRSPCSPICATTVATSTTSRPRERSRRCCAESFGCARSSSRSAGLVAGAVAGALLALLVTGSSP